MATDPASKKAIKVLWLEGPQLCQIPTGVIGREPCLVVAGFQMLGQCAEERVQGGLIHNISRHEKLIQLFAEQRISINEGVRYVVGHWRGRSHDRLVLHARQILAKDRDGVELIGDPQAKLNE